MLCMQSTMQESPICRTNLAVHFPNSTDTLTLQRSTSSEGLTTELQKLQIGDESYLPSSETTSTTSSSGEDEKFQLQKAKLNAFLEECNLERLERRWKDWDQANQRTQRRYVEQSSEIVKSVLSVVYPDNYGQLWKELKISPMVDKIMGTNQTSDNIYLDALAEAYKNATSWDTRRQVLSIMTGVSSHKEILRHIPGLTQYRYSIANLHRLQYGCAAPVPLRHASRLKIDRKQLDHFLSFITSPHLVQDLPFGEKTLKLSTGQVINVPNVIRTMIPQRIAKQYTLYCSESGFVPFSERTMLRILSECSASVRKSLQGLDYIAAEGARAFDDLLELIKATRETEAMQFADTLKAGKLYLKGDYKVKFYLPLKWH